MKSASINKGNFCLVESIQKNRLWWLSRERPRSLPVTKSAVTVCGRVQKWLRAMCQRNNKRSPRKDVARLKLRASRVIMPRLDGSRERISQPVAADLYDPRKEKIDWFQTVETRFVSGRMGVLGSLKGNIGHPFFSTSSLSSTTILQDLSI